MKIKISLRQIIFILLSLACMYIIFYFSSQNSDDSTQTSSKAVETVIKLFFGDYNSMPTEKQLEITDTVTFAVRKAAHFTIYLILGFCVSGIYKKNKFKSIHTPLTVTICMLYACSDEFHQSFSPGRSPQIRDVLIDTCGSFTGLIIFIVLYGAISKLINSKPNRTNT